ncbi:MAG: bifunctional diaminohydroxyphosphoribosylaminopyrimidine deaminase/5-amino-6-(5-phosphoribosylamino)uracil reductase RibD [Endozoicomonadaceae bacterium]|nr:bifunctional diaminohydroxyphosphoribosylaminopyrimidine deaminase/5-amino-6-(5-phosphoribosylamino)uracil reductase RibD [Endozoicomonadaceae bacterium]
MLFSDEQIHYMMLALRLAKRGLYTTMPNPRVGCVIVKSGQCIGQGWHQKAGEAHAEQLALQEAKEQAKQATVYVTLEPCSHWNKTSPCVDALIQAKVKAVIIAMIDPNPAVSGRGIARLRQAGISVTLGVLEKEARLLNIGFIQRMTRGYPWVRCKMAMSLDGRTGMSSGESKWITGPDARTEVHQLRQQSCGIMTGIGTILADDPALTVRLPDAIANTLNRHPYRIILDSKQRLPPKARILYQPGSVWWVSSYPFEKKDIFIKKMQDELKKKTAETLQHASLDTIVCAGNHHQIDLKKLLYQLGQRECNEILLESGAQLAGSMLQLDLIDEFWIYVAPRVMGSTALPLFDLHLQHLSNNKTLQIQSIEKIGHDWRIIALRS